jgi:diaminopimelate epimerase
MFFCWKYSANGNDFVITHTFLEGDRGRVATQICRRRGGIGADGFILLLPDPEPGVDFQWEFYNSDGSIAEMCGNGSRAAAHYAYKMGLVRDRKIKFRTLAGVIEAEVVGEEWVQVQLTPHRLLRGEFQEGGRRWWLWDTGVPHLVTIGESVEEFDLTLAREMRRKYNANVNWGAVEGGQFRVRTFERGVEGETLACGTGMCASFLTAQGLGLIGERSLVYPRSGEPVEIKIGPTGRLLFGGPVTPIFWTGWDPRPVKREILETEPEVL